MNKLLGLVLCGGESRRMGRDKGLLEKDGFPRALHVGRKMERCGIPVVYSISQKQEEAYRLALPSETFVVDALDLPGPQNGLFSVHQAHPDQDIFLLACDMLDMDEITIRRVLNEQQQGYDFTVYQEENWLQPFCGIYTAGGLDRVGPSPDGRLQTLLKSGKTQRLEDGNPAAFANCNTL